jgi:hypothetical protein
VTPPGALVVTEAFAAALELSGCTDLTGDYVGHRPTAKDYGRVRMYTVERSWHRCAGGSLEVYRPATIASPFGPDPTATVDGDVTGLGGAEGALIPAMPKAPSQARPNIATTSQHRLSMYRWFETRGADRFVAVRRDLVSELKKHGCLSAGCANVRAAAIIRLQLSAVCHADDSRPLKSPIAPWN